jgi:hypothetical protein
MSAGSGIVRREVTATLIEFDIFGLDLTTIEAGNYFFSASPTNSNNAFVPGSSGRPRAALILL